MNFTTQFYLQFLMKRSKSIYFYKTYRKEEKSNSRNSNDENDSMKSVHNIKINADRKMINYENWKAQKQEKNFLKK